MSGDSFERKVYFVTAKSYFKQCGCCSFEYEVTFMQDTVELTGFYAFSFFTFSSQP